MRDLTTYLLITLMSLFLLVGCQPDRPTRAEILEKGAQALGRNDLMAAYRYAQEALDDSCCQADSGSYLEAKAFLSILYLTMGQKKEAYETFRSLPTDGPHGRRQQVYLLCLNNLAYYTATIDKDYKKAKEYCQMVMKYVKQQDDIIITYTDILNIAEIYVIVGDTTEAIQLLNSVDTTRIVSQKMPCLAQLRLVETKILLKRKQYAQAQYKAKQLIQTNKSYWNINNYVEALSIIAMVDSMQGNINSYIATRNKLDSLRAEVYGDQMKYKLLLSEEQHKAEENKMKSAQRRMIYNAGIIILVIATLSLIIIIMMQIRKNKIQRHIAEMELSKFDEDIQRKRLENELLQLKMQQQSEELSKAYQDNVNMSMLLTDTPDSNNYATRLNYLEDLLKRKHANFLKQLSHDYPRLSYNETLIIGFMHMGLSSKEIATALGISIDSLNKARYRLRKKMGMISPEEFDKIIAAEQ